MERVDATNSGALIILRGDIRWEPTFDPQLAVDRGTAIFRLCAVWLLTWVVILAPHTICCPPPSTRAVLDADRLMRALAWTHNKLMFIVPFALSDAVAYNKGGKLDYGWDDLPFVKEYQAKHEGKMPSIVCDIFFFVPGCASGLFMNNMKSMLYDGYKVPGTPMTQMCPKDECQGGCQLCALKVAATTTTPTHHQDPPRIRPLTTHSPRTHHPLRGGCRRRRRQRSASRTTGSSRYVPRGRTTPTPVMNGTQFTPWWGAGSRAK